MSENNNTPNLQQSSHTSNRDLDDIDEPPRSVAKILFASVINATGLILGEVIPPTLHLTQKHVLPEILQSLLTLYDSQVPSRIQDWIEVPVKVFSHTLEVLLSSEKGKSFLRKLNKVLESFLEVSTGDKARQLLVDSIATLIKTGEILKSSEAKELIDHCAILASRIVDVLSTSNAKHLYHDVAQCIWAGIELVTDPEATVAIAQVTAHLCHVLEMEQFFHQPMSRQKLSKKEKAQQRKERGLFQKKIFLEKKVFNDCAINGSSVEDIFNDALNISCQNSSHKEKKELSTKEENSVQQSSLENSNEAMSKPNCFKPPKNVAIKIDGDEICDDAVSLPLSSSIISDSPSFYFRNHHEQNDIIDKDLNLFSSHSKKLSVDDHGDTGRSTPKFESVDKVDIEDLLKSNRDFKKKSSYGHSINHRVYNQIKDNLGVDLVQYEKDETDEKEVEDVDSCETDLNSSTLFQDSLLMPSKNQESETNEPAVNTYSGESSQFFQTLEKETNDRRIAALQNILNQTKFSPNSRTSEKEWFQRAAVAAGTGNELGQITYEKYISDLKTRANAGNTENEDSNSKLKSFSSSRTFLLITVLLNFMFILIIWFILGVYGLYMLFSSKNVTVATPCPPEINVHVTREVIVKSEIRYENSLFDFVEDTCFEENVIGDESNLLSTIDDDIQCLRSTEIEIITKDSDYKSDEQVERRIKHT